jgi:hypothetical protein
MRSRWAHDPRDDQHHPHHEEGKGKEIANTWVIPIINPSFLLSPSIAGAGVKSRLLDIPTMKLRILWLAI